MRNVHFKSGQKRFFEGWYLKHENGRENAAFIPGVSFDENGRGSAFIMTASADGASETLFDAGNFYAERNRFYIKIGDNEFSEDGVKINLRTPGISCAGELRYGAFTPLKKDVMGPLRLFRTECSHGIISLRHAVSGSLVLNGREISFDGGAGYIETDRGRSFPDKYAWVHIRDGGNVVVASAARVPFFGVKFRGHFAVVYENGAEHRFATYNGSKIVKLTERETVFKKGKDTLKIFLDGGRGQTYAALPLSAPDNGRMSRKITERLARPARAELYKNSELVLSCSSDFASSEFCF